MRAGSNLKSGVTAAFKGSRSRNNAGPHTIWPGTVERLGGFHLIHIRTDLPAGLITRIPDPGRLCRDHHCARLQCRGRSKLRFATDCPHRANWNVEKRRASNRIWMKVPWEGHAGTRRRFLRTN
jgi:hypothetical protein